MQRGRSISSILRGVATRTRNVSQYVLVFALCLVTVGCRLVAAFADGGVWRRATTTDDQGARMSASHGRQSLLLRAVQLVLHSALGDRQGWPGTPPSHRPRRRRPRGGGGGGGDGRRPSRSSGSRARLDGVPVVLVLPADTRRVDHRRAQLPAPPTDLPATPGPDRQGVRMRRSHARLNPSTPRRVRAVYTTKCDARDLACPQKADGSCLIYRTEFALSGA